MRVTEFELERLDPDRPNPFDALNEAFIFGMDKNLNVEITVEDAIVRFGDQSHEVNQGDVLNVSESAATFLCLKGWGSLI